MSDLSKKDLRKNLILNSIHEFSWGFGMAFHTTYAIVPLFLKQLGAPSAVVISVAGLFAFLFAIPQLISAAWARNMYNIKAGVIGVHGLLFPPIFMMSFVFSFLAPTGHLAWVYYYICFILYGLAIGFLLPIWAGFVHRTTNRGTRGSFIGISFVFNSVGGFIGGFLVKLLLSSSVPFPKNFGYGFFVYFFAVLIATIVFFGYRVRPVSIPTRKKSLKDFIDEMMAIIRTHSNFKRYLVGRIFFTANFPAISLYAVFMQDKLGFDVSEAGIFTAINVAAYGVASYSAGIIGDRYGHKKALLISFSAHLLAVITALLATSMFTVYLIFVFLGLGLGAFVPSSMNLVYDFAGERDNKLYMALIDSFLAPFTLAVIIIAGLVSSLFPLEWLFIGIGISLLISLFFIVFLVNDPRAGSQGKSLFTPI
jgi:AAHS family 3-hydroxyphenylpropionic acid transporter